MSTKLLKYTEWTRITWPFNTTMGLECWAKSFGRGTVYVGTGDFHNVTFSYGASSSDSYSSTRWDYDRPTITEEDAMKMVDAGFGRYMRGRKPSPIEV